MSRFEKMDNQIVEILKRLIESEGPEYIQVCPYETYQTLVASSDINRQVAGGVLLCILNGVLRQAASCTSKEVLADIIREQCSFSNEMSERLSSLLLSLYSPQNQAEWSRDKLKGLTDFLSKETKYSWEGFSTWEIQNIYIDCHYDASFVLKPSSNAAEDEGLRKLLDRNPFITRESIQSYFEEALCKHLDDAFDFYCTAEEYYEPVPEDFECESYLKDWCEGHGFVIVSFEGSGYDDGIQPLR